MGCPVSDSIVIQAIDYSSLNITSSVTDQSYFKTNSGLVSLSVSGGEMPYTYSWSNGGTPPYAFYWSNAATTEDVNNLMIGTYWVNITDANNCQFILKNIQVDSECTVSIIQQNQPVLTNKVFQASNFIQSNGKLI